jgi:hypothetical protein
MSWRFGDIVLVFILLQPKKYASLSRPARPLLFVAPAAPHRLVPCSVFILCQPKSMLVYRALIASTLQSPPAAASSPASPAASSPAPSLPLV